MTQAEIVFYVGTGIAVLAALAAVLSAIHADRSVAAAKRQAKAAEDQAEQAKVQALAAKVQAEAATAQVDIGKSQLQEMRKANELSAKIHAEDQAAHSLNLSLTPFLQEAAGKWWLSVRLDNNGRIPANIQALRFVFGEDRIDGTGFWQGDINVNGRPIPPQPPLSLKPAFPAVLAPGSSCFYVFAIMKIEAVFTINLVPHDYSEPHWRSFWGVELLANNQTLAVPEGDGQWRRQIVHGFASPR